MHMCMLDVFVANKKTQFGGRLTFCIPIGLLSLRADNYRDRLNKNEKFGYDSHVQPRENELCKFNLQPSSASTSFSKTAKNRTPKMHSV
jgi:hypothetical protein